MVGVGKEDLEINGRVNKMKLQQLLDELDNVIEQGSNDENITKVSVITAITDLVREFRGDDLDFMFERDDHYDSFEETDFTDLKIQD